jgi:hypothetical protein
VTPVGRLMLTLWIVLLLAGAASLGWVAWTVHQRAETRPAPQPTVVIPADM